MEVGAALGVASLVLQLLAGCVEGFAVLSTSQDLGKDGLALLCMLNLEEYRLIEWAKRAGILNKPPHVDIRLNQQLIQVTLQQLKDLLKDTNKLKSRYKLDLTVAQSSTQEPSPTPSTPSKSLLSSAHRILDDAISDETRRDILLRAGLIKSQNWIPKRLWWAKFDKGKFEDLVQTIHGLVQNLWGLLDTLRLDDLIHQVSETLKNSVRINDKVELLVAIQEVVGTTAASQFTWRADDTANAAGAKALRLALGESGQRPNLTALALAPLPLENIAPQMLLSRSVGSSGRGNKDSSSEVEIAEFSGKGVYVEWKELTASSKSKLRSRIENLAILLRDSAKETFRILRCCGTCEDGPRVGFVFEHPSPFNHKMPISLKRIMTSQYDLQPSASERLALALQIIRAVQALHLAGWLHKNLRPENVLFFPSEPIELPSTSSQSIEGTFGKPFLGGFAFARESSPTAISEQPSKDPLRDIYRHPNAMGEPSEAFDEMKDNYSLGTILIEIAEWRSLQSLIEKDRVAKITEHTTLEELCRVRPHLIRTSKGSILDRVAFRMGDSYRETVRACLGQNIAAGVDEYMSKDVDEAVRQLQGCRI